MFKLFLSTLLGLFISVLGFSQINIKGQYGNESWDLFWLVKPSQKVEAPETIAARGRTVYFNFDLEEQITSAVLHFDYFDGDFLVGARQQYTSFDVLIDGYKVATIHREKNEYLRHLSVDVLPFLKDKTYSLPVTFVINQPNTQDGAVIARPFLVINDEKNIQGKYGHEGWDMFWLDKKDNKYGAPEGFSARGRTVDFNIDIGSNIEDASLEFDYFNSNLLIDLRSSFTSFKVIIDGMVVESVDYQENTAFKHKSIDVSPWIKEKRYSLPVTFELNQEYSENGVIIARPYLVLNKNGIVNQVFEPDFGQMEFSLYPNPTVNDIRLSFLLNRNATFHYKILDVNGKEVKSFGFKNYFDGVHEEAFSFNGLSSGSYFLVVSESGYSYSIPFVING